MTGSLLSLSLNKDPILLLVTSEWINSTSKDPNLFTSNKINNYIIFIILQIKA